jgi:hypothetical protein
MKESSFFVMLEVAFVRLKSVQILTISSWPYTSVALMAQYLNVCQHCNHSDCLVYILEHDSADRGSLPMRDFSMANLSYFQ